jgi:uncharacterized protein YkwD
VRAVLRPVVLALSTALLSGGLLGGGLLGGGLLSPAGAATTTTSREAALLDKISEARADHGLAPLRLDADLSDHARRHSATMAVHDRLFHTVDFGVVCCWSAIAENIAYDATVTAAHRAFMGSLEHRANILDPGMRRVGVGVVESAGVLWVTEVFSKPS